MKKSALLIAISIMSACSGNTGSQASFFPVPCLENISEDSPSAYARNNYYILGFYDDAGNRLDNFDKASVLLSKYNSISFNNYPLPQDGLYLFDNIGKANGYYDLEGNCILSFDKIKENIGYGVGRATNFSEGLAFIQSNTLGEQRFVINKNGDVLYETTCMAVSPFRNGYAYVEEDWNYGIISSKGEIVVKPDEEIIHNGSGTGLQHETYCVEGDDGYAIKDFSGNIVIDYISYEPMWIDDNGNAIYCSKEYPHNYGLVNKSGKKLTEPKYLEMKQDGELYWFMDENENVGWCDAKGETVIPAIDRDGKPLPFYGSKYSYMRATNPNNPDEPLAYLYTKKELNNGTYMPSKVFFNTRMLTPFVNEKAIAWDMKEDSHLILNENDAFASANLASFIFISPLRWDDYENIGEYIANPLTKWHRE